MFLFIICFIVLSLSFVAESQPKILVVYYSQTGHTKAMAEAVARGAKSSPGAIVTLKAVNEATAGDVLAADAVIVGSPVHNANVAPEVQRFINSWPFEGQPLKDKIGAAFVTGGGISAGEELVQTNILHSMLVFGMVVVGGPEWTAAFGASGVTGEPPFESKTIDPMFLKKAEELGKRVADLAARLKK
ncbi:MAG: NAD(P)H-dependent oxidoreductase [Ignavibacteriales bacterium]|nr:NAD(P)H-dependent oxidoreductase [Ignavibacteriales bacterium]